MNYKNKVTGIITALFVCTTALCAAQPVSQGELTVSITPGAYWKTERNPQFAVWVEKADGTYVTTLYVTQRAAKKNWLFSPKGGRPESLPVWYHAVNSAVVVVKTQSPKTDTDVLTSATPGASDKVQKSVQLPTGEVYIVKVEVNHSFDYNESWPKKAKKGSAQYSGVNGQPSVVYAGTLDTKTTATPEHGAVKIVLEPAGTGAIDGSDGNLHDNLANLTTALQIIAGAEASWSCTK
jgi:hypothetical protein